MKQLLLYYNLIRLTQMNIRSMNGFLRRLINAIPHSPAHLRLLT